jgi:hypothetical protein
MHLRRIATFVVCAAVCASLPGLGQRLGTGNGIAQTPKQPYKAEFKSTSVRTLADGTTITQESTEVRAVDSQGRTMTSTTHVPSGNEQSATTSVTVFDPVAGTRTSWNSRTNKAMSWKLPTAGATSGCTGSAVGTGSFGTAGMETVPNVTISSGTPNAGANRPKPVREELGNANIQGVEAHGMRVTTTTPVGDVGNDHPLVRIREIWRATAPGLSYMTVREITEDPLLGKSTKELVSFTPGEPEMSNFMPPEGYEGVNREMRPVQCGVGGVR